jgi:hypothetical protein
MVRRRKADLDKAKLSLSRSLRHSWEGCGLQTLFDWISILIFAGLVVLYLQRSMADGPPVDRIAH